MPLVLWALEMECCICLLVMISQLNLVEMSTRRGALLWRNIERAAPKTLGTDSIKLYWSAGRRDIFLYQFMYLGWETENEQLRNIEVHLKS